MVCALSHTLSCPQCWDNPAGPDCKHDPKCCPSGELTSDPCGCCQDCAKGRAIYNIGQLLVPLVCFAGVAKTLLQFPHGLAVTIAGSHPAGLG